MSICIKLNFVNIKYFSLVTSYTQKCTYAKAAAPAQAAAASKKKKAGKLGPVVEKKVLPVETDPEKLVNYVCGSNIYKEGEDVKLKPDSEYPDWLWNLRTTKVTLDDLDPNTKQYWLKVRKMGLKRNNLIKKTRPF